MPPKKRAKKETNLAQLLCDSFQHAYLENNRLKFPHGTNLPMDSSGEVPMCIVRPMTRHVQLLYEYVCNKKPFLSNGLLVIGPPGCGKVMYQHSHTID